MRHLRRWIRNICLTLLLVLTLGVGAGQVQQIRLARAYPAPGELLEVGDRRVHVMRAGTGPTVVFENGPGGMAVDWSLVAPAVSEFATSVAYDRAGLGWSEREKGGPRDIAALVEELKATLQAAGASPPYVLVGHSYGGLIVRTYAYTYPEEVRGLVLVDSAHEDQFEMYPEEYAAKARSLGQQMRRLRWIYRGVVGSGIPALFPSRFENAVASRLPGELAAARTAVTLVSGSHSVTSVDEMAALATSFDRVRQIRRPLGNVTVRIISHGRPAGSEAGVPRGLEDEVEAAWQEMQRQLLSISTDASLEVAEGSGHDIHLERPEVIIEAVRRILEG